MIDATLTKLEKNHFFTEPEAWKLFRLAAIGEAVGWSMLISGLLFKHFITPHDNAPVLLVGQLHGTIFLFYIVVVIITYSSLRWSRKRTFIAGLASIPPYGTLVFEQWAAYKRRGEALKTYREVTVRAIIVQAGRLLVIQPKDSGFWYLPGGLVVANETVEAALQRHVSVQTGVTPTIDRLAYVRQQRRKATEGLELFFIVANPSEFKEKKLQAAIKQSGAVDEVSYINPSGNGDLVPNFLRTEPVIKVAKTKTTPTIFIDSDET